MLAFFRVLSRLPLRVLHAAGVLAGLAAYALSGDYRRKLRRHLALAGYPRSLRGAAAREAGRLVGELPFVWFRPLAEVAARVRCDDVAVVDAAERSARGLLFLTPHLGSFEVTARWYSARRPITVMFKPPRQPALARVMAAARSGPTMRSVPAALAGVRAMLRALRRGEAVGLLPDQVPGAGEGQWAPFFGQPAYTMTLPLRLAQASGAVVVLAVGERLPGGRGWRLHLERLDEAPGPVALNAAMERLIRRFPAQYLWGYNRYKAPSGAAAASRPDGAVPPSDGPSGGPAGGDGPSGPGGPD